ncbi:MAG: hypothetical protein QW275_00110, partial [Candidatus Anstonellaceae archaeon]
SKYDGAAMEIKRATVVANEKKPIARLIKKQAEAMLEEKGIKVSSSSPNLVVTVGGDGTVLFSKNYYGVPFFAIGSNTSFICQAKFSNWKEKLSKAISRPVLEKRLLLSCLVDGKRLPYVLNEVGIRNPQPRVLSIHLSAGKKDFAFRADGVLFSTPTGSPAYAYSCGGKQMKKWERKYQVVAISSFRRIFKPMILDSSVRCKVRISGSDKAQIFLDGQSAGWFGQNNILSVSAAKKPFYFLRV